MDFELSEDQRAFADTARAFAQSELSPHAAEWDREAAFPRAASGHTAESWAANWEALGALGHAESLDLLKEYMENDPLEVIRQTCELAIARIEWEASDASKTEKLTESAFTSIDPAPPLPTDESEIPKLKALLNNQEESLFKRYRAMFSLRDIATKEAVLALASGFDDPSALFRHEIAYVFGQLCSPDSVPALIKVLGNDAEEGMVRHEAAEALGSIATDEVLPVLNKFAQDNERVVRESAIVALDMYEFENSDQVDYTVVPA